MDRKVGVWMEIGILIIGIGSRFGLNTETANSNPTFSINKQRRCD